MTRIYLGIGTNLGDKEENIRRAVAHIGQRIGRGTQVAPLYRSAPWGFVSAHEFANTALCVDTELTPEQLLKETQAIERDMGRLEKSAGGGYTDRIIDIDILLYGESVVDAPELKIPHPLLQERDFVVVPLAAIAPDLIHPTLQMSMGELAARFR